MKTKNIQRNTVHPSGIDDKDRMILRLLAEQADQSYAELSKKVHLSAPAVHERVKRLKRDGVILGVSARLNGEKIGCPLLAFVHVVTEGWSIDEQILGLRELADVEEIHTATGDTSLILKVRTANAVDLEELLSSILKVEGICSTRTYVILRSYLERGPMPSVSLLDGSTSA